MTLRRIYEKNEPATSSAPMVSLHLVLTRAEPSPRSQEGVITFIPSPLKMISSSETGRKKKKKKRKEHPAPHLTLGFFSLRKTSFTPTLLGNYSTVTQAGIHLIAQINTHYEESESRQRIKVSIYGRSRRNAQITSSNPRSGKEESRAPGFTGTGSFSARPPLTF